MTKHILIAGASGVVGNSALDAFRSADDCKVTVVSRRPPLDLKGANFISVDLLDEEKSKETFKALGDVTHLIYAAVIELEENGPKGWTDPLHAQLNERMLRNLLGPLESVATNLEHVTIIHGGKAYGMHVRAMPIPSREGRDELRTIPNFYFNQEAYVRELQKGKSWSWTILRPQYVVGFALNSPMTLVPVLGVYAALQKEKGEPFHWTGGTRMIVDATDADLLASAMRWAASSERAKNDIFNVTNGDIFSWRGIWPALADAFGIEMGEDRPTSLMETIPPQAELWNRIKDKHKLVGEGFAGVDPRAFGWLDRAVAYGFTRPLPTQVVSTIKIRSAGFADCIDTEDSFRKWIRHHQEARLLPMP